jgi:hypothetical protein
MPDEDPDVSIKTIPQAFQRRIRTGVYHGQQNGKRLKLCKQGHCADVIQSIGPHGIGHTGLAISSMSQNDDIKKVMPTKNVLDRSKDLCEHGHPRGLDPCDSLTLWFSKPQNLIKFFVLLVGGTYAFLLLRCFFQCKDCDTRCRSMENPRIKDFLLSDKTTASTSGKSGKSKSSTSTAVSTKSSKISTKSSSKSTSKSSKGKGKSTATVSSLSTSSKSSAGKKKGKKK